MFQPGQSGNPNRLRRGPVPIGEPPASAVPEDLPEAPQPGNRLQIVADSDAAARRTEAG
jgi:hypothetical protein